MLKFTDVIIVAAAVGAAISLGDEQVSEIATDALNILVEAYDFDEDEHEDEVDEEVTDEKEK